MTGRGSLASMLPRLLCAAALLAGLAGCEKKHADEPTTTSETTALLLYCGAGLRPAAAEAAEAFTAEAGVDVQIDYAGSGMLISRVRLDRRGDLFMPGDVWYLQQVEAQGLLDSKEMVTYFVPVIIVGKGMAKEISKLEDLARPGVRLAVGDPRACQIGRLTLRIFAKNHIDADAVNANTRMQSVTVNELGVWVKTGRADAAIVWDAIAAQYADAVEIVPIPPERNIISRVAIGVLSFSKSKPAARRFVDFLAGEKGKAIFRKHHYRTSPP